MTTTSSVALDHDAHLGEPTLALVGEPVVAPLSFKELNRRLSAIPDRQQPIIQTHGVARMAMFVAAVSWLAALVIPHVGLPATVEAVALLSLLVVEMACVVLAVWYSRSEYVSLFNPLEDLAETLDHHLPFHIEIRDWLAAQPITTLEKFAAMAKYRRERFAQKLPILAGNVATLGVVPVIAAVFYQGHQIVEDLPMTWMEGVLGFLLILFYTLSMTMTFSKLRLDAMDAHLQAALEKVRA
jgi:hypothetical protein